MKIIGFLICMLLIAAPILSATVSKNDIVTINIKSNEKQAQHTQGVTDIDPKLKSGPSASIESTSKITAERPIKPLEPWDVLLEFDVTQSDYIACCGADPDYIYAAEWSGSNIYRFDYEGNYVDSFSISGASNFRDMAYDHATGYM